MPARAVGDLQAAVAVALAASTVRPVIVAPTHNNAATLPQMLERMNATGLAVIVVDDGSTDTTASILAEWATHSVENRVCTHLKNQGKAAALRTGFIEAARAGYTHGISIDTDGQLSPEDIPALLKLVASNETAMVLGVRDARAAGYPVRSRLGRWISNLLIRAETGQQVADSQCGLRIYPLKLVNTIRCASGHYGFETEIITRAIWAQTPILQALVHCKYFSDGARVTHFKPFVDSLRAMRMHARLLMTAMNPIHRKNVPPGAAPVHSVPRQFLHWINPITAWRQVRHTPGAREKFSLGFAIGVFVSSLPIYGLQSVSALFIAKKFRMNPVSVFAGANISVPPFGPVMIACSIAVGHLVLHGSWPSWKLYEHAASNLHQVLIPMLVEWAIGSVIFGAVLSIVAFIVLDLLLRLVSDPPGEANTSTEQSA